MLGTIRYSSAGERLKTVIIQGLGDSDESRIFLSGGLSLSLSLRV